MPTDYELMRMQVAALFTHDAEGRIRVINEGGGGPAPRFFIGLTRQGNLWRFRHDLPDDVVRELTALAAQEPPLADLAAGPVHYDAFQVILARQANVAAVYHGPAYWFPRPVEAPPNTALVDHTNVELLRLLIPDDPDLAAVARQRWPCVVAVEHGVGVSCCFSARFTPRSAEAGIWTLPDYQRRGFAALAATGWAAALQASGRTATYSTSWDNHASQAVARKLGLRQYGVDLSFS